MMPENSSNGGIILHVDATASQWFDHAYSSQLQIPIAVHDLTTPAELEYRNMEDWPLGEDDTIQEVTQDQLLDDMQLQDMAQVKQLIEESQTHDQDMNFLELNTHIGTSNMSRTDTSQEINTIDNHLAQYGLRRHGAIYGDGNCLFRAVSFALYQTQEHHRDLRQTAVDYIRQHQPEFEPQILGSGQSIDHYLTEMSRPGVYGDFSVVVALSRYLDRTILITQGNSERVAAISTNPDEDYIQSHIHLVYLSENSVPGGHYDTVIDNIVDNEVTVGQIEDNPTSPNSLQPEQSGYTCTANVSSSLHQSYTLKTLETQSKKHQCPVCNKQFSSISNLNRHSKRTHTGGDNENKTKKSVDCTVPSCDQTFRTVLELVKHLQEHHSLGIEKTDLEFPSFSEFKVWKETEECSNNVFYKRRSSQSSKNSKTSQYVCNRSGDKNKSMNKVRPMRKKGSCLIGGLCPARMFVTEKNNMVSVKYIRTHFHETNSSQSVFLPIPESTRTAIKRKLSLNVPVNCIQSQLRCNVSDLDTRNNSEFQICHKISKKDIHNIKQQQINVARDRHSDDATSVHLRVLDLQKCHNNPILLYKQQHLPNDTNGFLKNDFCLVLMTNEQACAFEEFGSHVVCIDSTHGTNQYAFFLITLLVIDNFHHGYLVAFCISNREDELTMTRFLQVVHDRCPNTNIECVLTDDTHTSSNAARNVFGPDVGHYLCVYHVMSSWTRKLPSYIPRDLVPEFQAHLKGLIYSYTLEEYHNKLRDFKEKYESSYPRFFEYFDKYYSYRSDKWSLYARKEGLQRTVTTNNHIESFHKTLKYCYFDQKVNRRLDKLVDVLLDIERNCFIDRTNRKRTENINQDKSGKHKSSIDISDNFLNQINECLYSISSSDGDTSYYINVLKKKCDTTPCYVTCSIPPCNDLCIHLYKCSCPDVSLCCKHIHKLHSFISKNNVRSKDSDTSIISTPSINKLTADKAREISFKRHLETFQSLVNKLSAVVVERKDPSMTQKVNKALSSILADCEALDLLCDKPAQELGPKHKIPPNKKVEKQPLFSRTMRKKSKSKLTNKKTKVQVGNVRQYPPLQLQKRNTLPQITNDEHQNFFSVKDGIGIPNNFLAPPALSRVVTLDNNKKTIVLNLNFGNANSNDTVHGEESI